MCKHIQGDNVEDFENGIGIVKILGDFYYLSNLTIPIKLEKPLTIYTLPIYSFRDIRLISLLSIPFLFLISFLHIYDDKFHFFPFIKIFLSYSLFILICAFFIILFLLLLHSFKLSYFKKKVKNYVVLNNEGIEIVNGNNKKTFKFNEIDILVNKNIIGYTVSLYKQDSLYSKDFTVLDFNEARTILSLYKAKTQSLENLNNIKTKDLLND